MLVENTCLKENCLKCDINKINCIECKNSSNMNISD